MEKSRRKPVKRPRKVVKWYPAKEPWPGEGWRVVQLEDSYDDISRATAVSFMTQAKRKAAELDMRGLNRVYSLRKMAPLTGGFRPDIYWIYILNQSDEPAVNKWGEVSP